MRRTFAKTSFGQVHFREAGSGDSLLLLHQTADSSRLWLDVFPGLAERFHVVAMDTPGYGNSDQPAEPLGIEGYGRAVVEFLDAVGIDQAHVIGHHTGASFAVEVAATYPDRVDKLILSGCPDYEPDERPGKLVHAKPATIKDDGDHLRKAWKRIAFQMAPWARLDQMQTSVIDTLQASPNYYFAYLAVFGTDVRERIPRISAPTLLMGGEHDEFTPRHELLKPLFRQAETHVIENASAVTMLECPDEFNRVVLDFLTR